MNEPGQRTTVTRRRARVAFIGDTLLGGEAQPTIDQTAERTTKSPNPRLDTAPPLQE